MITECVQKKNNGNLMCECFICVSVKCFSPEEEKMGKEQLKPYC